VEELVSKVGKAKYRILCADDLICYRLRSIGLPSDLVDYSEDFDVWHISHRLVKQWKSILKSCPSSTYLGVNALEFSSDSFAFMLKVRALCADLAKAGYEVAFIILNKYFNRKFPTLNASSIVTVCYGPRLRELRAFLGILRRHCHRSGRITRSADISFGVRSKSCARGLCLIGASTTRSGDLTDYYLRPAVSILTECHSVGIRFKCVVDMFVMGQLLHKHGLDYEIVSGPKLRELPRFLFDVMLRFIRLRKFLVRAACRDDSLRLTLPLVLQGMFSNYYTGLIQINFFESLITSLSPKILLAIPDRGRTGRIGVEVARRHHVPSLTVQAGLIDEHPENGILIADKVAVMGQQARRIYLRKGVDPSRVVVTGMAHWDSIFRRHKQQDHEELRRHGIDTKKRIVVFATENIPFAETSRMIEGTISEILKWDQTVLAIKIHPREDTDIYRKMTETYPPDKVVATRDIDLYSLLSSCEVLVNGFSNVTLEAMMIGKPVVSINLSGKPDKFPFEEFKAALVVRRYEDIPPAIATLLSKEKTLAELDQGRRNCVTEYAHLADGKASYRIAVLIAASMGQHKI